MAGVMSAMSQGPSVFLLAGQSNMSGRGGVINDNKTNSLIWNGQVPPECSPNPNILTLDLDKTWKVAQEPLHHQIDRLKPCGIGPGMHFAHEILAKDPSFGAIGLVPCAIGGTKIAQWQKGTPLYNLLVVIASAEGNYMDAVRNAEMTIRLKNVQTVDAMGSTFIQDQKHLNSESQIRLGQKLAEKFSFLFFPLINR
ncbi:hypothetical protein F2P56_034137 [Juglans regia]|uniref:Sialate O-acetylesterase domain-containing protein n=2 Tax=Juglans regia TaxID=51240 RepID=A0A833T9B3_JUGRE|nr:probable carbohydrate esterase At4g34215 [Juglans regia]KAF5445055.1 hypothetical protein F2P56_034137 [Juglans regia]